MNLPWIQTRSGIAFTPTAPRVEDLIIQDIAWSLAQQPRFKGHTFKPYTVAEHCVRMSHMVSPEAAPWALLHDGAEAYIGDIPGPLKHLAPGLIDAEERIDVAMIEKWHGGWVSPAIRKEVDTCDKWIVHEEAKLLMGPRPYPWFPQPDFKPLQSFPDDLEDVGWSFDEAYIRYLLRFQHLMPIREEKVA